MATQLINANFNGVGGWSLPSLVEILLMTNTQAWTPTQLSNVVGVWRADQGVTVSAGNVTQWLDQSPNAIAMVATGIAGYTLPTFSATGFNSSFPGINYVEVNFPGLAASTTFASAILSLVVVGTETSTVSNPGIVNLELSGNDSVSGAFTFFDGTNQFSSASIQAYSSGFIGNSGNAVAVGNNTPFIGGFIADGTNFNLFANSNVPTGTGSPFTTTLGAASNAILYFGSDHNRAAWNGTMAAVVLTTAAMSSTDLSNVIFWANATFGTSFPDAVSGPVVAWSGAGGWSLNLFEEPLIFINFAGVGGFSWLPIMYEQANILWPGIGNFWQLLPYEYNPNAEFYVTEIAANFDFINAFLMGVGGWTISPLQVDQINGQWVGVGNWRGLFNLFENTFANANWNGVGGWSTPNLVYTGFISAAFHGTGGWSATAGGAIIATSIQLAAASGPNFTINITSTTNAGDLVGNITVGTNIPGTYVGTITIGGANASLFSLSNTSNVLSASYPCALYVSQSNILPTSYAITLTATP